MKNQYKRQDIFLCTHDAHRKRGHHVSIYHTLRKGCFPNGCTYFRWKCIELEHRRKCYRGYTHVGRNCEGCRFFDDEKVTRVLIKQDEAAFNGFVEELHDFEEWLRDHEGKTHDCRARVRSVKPHVRIRGGVQGPATTQLAGYLLCLENTFIGNERIDDPVFSVMSKGMQARLRFRKSDEVSFDGVLSIDDGRLRLDHWKRIHFHFRSEEETVWTDSDSLVVRSTGTLLKHQAEKCVACDQGMLVDVHEREHGFDRLYHRIFCLQGMPSAAACSYETTGELYSNTCSNRLPTKT